MLFHLRFGVSFKFFASIRFNTLIGGIRVLDIPLGSLSFTSFFFQKVLDDDIQHIDALHELGDLGFSLFHLKVFLPFSFFSPLHNFQH